MMFERRISRAEFLVITVLCVCRSVIETGKRFPVLFLQGGKHRSVASYEAYAEQQLTTFGLAHAALERETTQLTFSFTRSMYFFVSSRSNSASWAWTMKKKRFSKPRELHSGRGVYNFFLL